MKGLDKIKFILIETASIFAGFLIFDSKFNAYSELIIFLSIMLGFLIVAISVIFNSPLKKVLYNLQNKSYRTELHRLKSHFHFSAWLIIIYMLMIFLIPKSGITIFTFELEKHLIVMPILIGSILCFHKIYNELLKIFVYPTNY